MQIGADFGKRHRCGVRLDHDEIIEIGFEFGVGDDFADAPPDQIPLDGVSVFFGHADGETEVRDSRLIEFVNDEIGVADRVFALDDLLDVLVLSYMIRLVQRVRLLPENKNHRNDLRYSGGFRCRLYGCDGD